jgi:hypothetical protein
LVNWTALISRGFNGISKAGELKRPSPSIAMYPGLITGSKHPHPKAKFSQEEDVKLMELVGEHGAENWQKISQHLHGRNSRQCRDRWLNYLSPEVVNGPWSREEEQLLIAKYRELGPMWK